MSFAEHIDQVLPGDLPHREQVVSLCARHLEAIAEINPVMNLTRITSEREAAIKHVLDSLLPWRLFAGATLVVDAGTGAGFPGIPLSIVLPDTRFVLLESIQKKSRFVASVIEQLALPNVEARPLRAEDWLKSHTPTLITARAMAPLERALPLFAPALKRGATALLFKGPDLAAEITAADREIRRHHLSVTEALRYELPDAAGIRTIARAVLA
ncbi:MAG: 16S rRNA (guanine(527)-N(7))-methyltransferase RsmG [Acidobacteriota bacterium]